VVGVGLVVAVTFVLIALFVRRATAHGIPTYDLLRVGAARWLAGPAVAGALRVGAVACLGLVAAAALFGSRVETWNIAPTFVWVVAWIAIPALQLLVGDVWRALNPWAAVHDWVAGARRPARPWPAWLGIWPAVALFLGLVWLKAAVPAASDVRVLGVLIVVYSAVTWAGMALFGRDVWLARAECFTVFYGLIAAAAPTEVREASGRRQLLLRPWAVGLLARPPAGADTAVFVLLMLAGGMFGGLLDTRWWESFRVGLGLTAQRVLWQDTLAFAGFVAVTLGVYGLSCALVRLASGPTLGVREVAIAFAYPMVPLAAGFHLTHGLDHTLESLQLLVRLVSDPFGFGWDLFGTRALPLGKPSAWLVWYAQVVVIVGVHVAGIWVAHVRALALYRERGAALRSQVPMVGVMVLFTISGLWILSKIPMVM
jgi:hypothetical protein